MSDRESQSTDDQGLSYLSAQQGLAGSIARAFLVRRGHEDREWLDKWFLLRIERYYAQPPSDFNSLPDIDLSSCEMVGPPLSQPVRLKSLQINYFRGFREGLGEIDLGGNLVVVQGKNSSGKTSLAEALEWLFSGSLSRRESSLVGNVRELAECIANRHRPPNQETWVSAAFATESENGNAKEFTLRRILHEDYGAFANATCSSVLYLDHKALLPNQEKQVLDRFFAGVPPLLMQHSLREFVHGDPKLRRRYFERLLRLDEISELIRQAQVSDLRLAEFPSPNEDKYIELWNQLISLLLNSSSRDALSQWAISDAGNSLEVIPKILSSLSRIEFPSLLDEISKREMIVATLVREQERVRQKSFPLLGQLQPRRRVSNHPPETTSAKYIAALGKEMRIAWDKYEPTLIAIQALDDKDLAVSKAFEILFHAGTIQKGKDSQNCPLCAHEGDETLSSSRISAIEGWNSVRDAEQASQQDLIRAKNSLLEVVVKALEDYEGLIPSYPSESEWDQILKTVGGQLKEETEKLRKASVKLQGKLLPFVLRGRKLVEQGRQNPLSSEQCEAFIEDATEVALSLASVPIEARAYGDALESLEHTIGTEAEKDPEYRLRECIVSCFKNASSIVEDLRWMRAKRLAQQELKMIRESLISYRQHFLEDRRMKFNRGIESVWSSLRDERYSAFSQLHIPQPRGVGFPVEIGLKALLDDSNEQIEVDALSVFSESQVNALGIAAFVTRSQMLGHRILVFDDPVQSMDEDHFYTFARNLIPDILRMGFQIVLLTHNDAFARGISYHNNDFPEYVTLKTVHRRKTGSVVEEGNRTIPERLKKAGRNAEEGDFDSAWTTIRLVIERLYTLAYKKYGPDRFDPASWKNLAAEDMWEKGAQDAILTRQPDSGKRLKEILTMSAAGSHDKATMGETEVRESVKFLRKLSHNLKVGR